MKTWRKVNLSRRTGLLVLLAIELTVLGRYVERFLREFPGPVLALLLVGGGSVLGSFLVVAIYRRQSFTSTSPRLITAGAVVTGTILYLLSPAPIEFSHILLFGAIGFSGAHDCGCSVERDGVRKVVPVYLSVCFFAIFDEFLQWIHPQRVADFRDVALNCTGAALGLLVSLMLRKRPMPETSDTKTGQN